MELEVRVVAGVENCYVSLPLSLLQTLESIHPDHRLPHLLPLQLRSLSDDRHWHVHQFLLKKRMNLLKRLKKEKDDECKNGSEGKRWERGEAVDVICRWKAVVRRKVLG